MVPDTSCANWYREPDVELSPDLESSACCMLSAACCCTVVTSVNEDVVELAPKLPPMFCCGLVLLFQGHHCLVLLSQLLRVAVGTLGLVNQRNLSSWRKLAGGASCR